MDAISQTAKPAITDQEAFVIGVEAYLYFYPLITMDITRKQTVNIEAGEEFGKGPMNTFIHLPEYPPADFKTVVRPNFDTLYSTAWLDLTKGPVVVSVPDTNGRYYLLPMLDMWTDVFASPGWRTTGTKAGEFLITPPDWVGVVPDRMTKITAPTPYVWIIGRTKTDGPQDYDAVHTIQAGYKISTLSTGQAPRVEVAIDPSIDMKTPPKTQVDTMSPEAFFAYAAELFKLHPPHSTDQPIIARMARIGLERGKSYDLNAQSDVIRNAVARGAKIALELMAWKVPTLARVVNGWTMDTDTMGVYGNYYLKRAMIAQLGLGANLPEDAIYPLNIGDSDGKPLVGSSAYTLHFEKSELPPVGAFWSITLYDNEGFQVANQLDRFAVSSWMAFNYNSDGSLDLYFQNKHPGADKEANWLPAPAGPFNITMRLYSPLPAVLIGKWNPPAVKETVPTARGQREEQRILVE